MSGAGDYTIDDLKAELGGEWTDLSAPGAVETHLRELDEFGASPAGRARNRVLDAREARICEIEFREKRKRAA